MFRFCSVCLFAMKYKEHRAVNCTCDVMAHHGSWMKMIRPHGNESNIKTQTLNTNRLRVESNNNN